MKNFKCWPLPLVALLLLFACSDDEPFEPDPELVAQARLKMEISLPSYKITDSIEDEVISVEDNDMNNMTSLVYVVHNAETGKFVKFQNIGKEDLQALTENTFTILEDNLPFGNYYISVVILAETEMDGLLLAKGLQQDYPKAAFQIPNSTVYYATKEVDCSIPHGMLPEFVEKDLDYRTDIKTRCITGVFTVLLPKGSKGIPDNARFDMTVEATNIPSGFSLQTGKALTTQQTEELGLSKFNDLFKITRRFDNQIVAQYHILPNDDLQDTAEERGFFKFVYKEDAASGEVDRLIEMKIPEFTQIMRSYAFIFDLYNVKQPKVEVLNR